MDTKTLRLRLVSLGTGSVRWILIAIVVLVLGVPALLLREQWLPQARGLFDRVTGSANANRSEQPKAAAVDEHEGHDHDHPGHNESDSLQLSSQARKNARLLTATVQLQTFVRTASMPAIVLGRPGRSELEVTAPLGGRVTRIYAVEGAAVVAGEPLFDLRLTHEELVQAQSAYLRTAEELDVVAREITRLNSIKIPGAIPGKTVREREYEQQKLKAVANAQHQSLLLHGLTTEQVGSILETRTLVQDVTVVAANPPATTELTNPISSSQSTASATASADTHPLTVRALHVRPGQYIDAGTPLCRLVDYAELYVQGRAFEQDSEELLQAAREQWEITAIQDDGPAPAERIQGLKIEYVANEIDPESRALHFFVGLPNAIEHEGKSPDGHRFLNWRYKLGQRLQLQVPVERWPERIVLPIEAVAKEGLEFYVFQQNGDHFDRVEVHVEYQDQLWAVVANDGSIFPGDVVATRGAQQLQMALKNKAGGGVDPHAGHNH